MAISLQLTVSETSTSLVNNTSSVKVSVDYTWTNGTKDTGAKLTLVVDGSKKINNKSFSVGGSGAGSGNITTWSGTIAHDTDGSKSLITTASLIGASISVSASKTTKLTTLKRRVLLSSVSSLVVCKTTVATLIKEKDDLTYEIYLEDTETGEKLYTFNIEINNQILLTLPKTILTKLNLYDDTYADTTSAELVVASYYNGNLTYQQYQHILVTRPSAPTISSTIDKTDNNGYYKFNYDIKQNSTVASYTVAFCGKYTVYYSNGSSVTKSMDTANQWYYLYSGNYNINGVPPLLVSSSDTVAQKYGYIEEGSISIEGNPQIFVADSTITGIFYEFGYRVGNITDYNTETPSPTSKQTLDIQVNKEAYLSPSGSTIVFDNSLYVCQNNSTSYSTTPVNSTNLLPYFDRVQLHFRTNFSSGTTLSKAVVAWSNITTSTYTSPSYNSSTGNYYITSPDAVPNNFTGAQITITDSRGEEYKYTYTATPYIITSPTVYFTEAPKRINTSGVESQDGTKIKFAFGYSQDSIVASRYSNIPTATVYVYPSGGSMSNPLWSKTYTYKETDTTGSQTINWVSDNVSANLNTGLAYTVAVVFTDRAKQSITNFSTLPGGVILVEFNKSGTALSFGGASVNHTSNAIDNYLTNWFIGNRIATSISQYGYTGIDGGKLFSAVPYYEMTWDTEKNQWNRATTPTSYNVFTVGSDEIVMETDATTKTILTPQPKTITWIPEENNFGSTNNKAGTSMFRYSSNYIVIGSAGESSTWLHSIGDLWGIKEGLTYYSQTAFNSSQDWAHISQAYDFSKTFPHFSLDEGYLRIAQPVFIQEAEAINGWELRFGYDSSTTAQSSAKSYFYGIVSFGDQNYSSSNRSRGDIVQYGVFSHFSGNSYFGAESQINKYEVHLYHAVKMYGKVQIGTYDTPSSLTLYGSISQTKGGITFGSTTDYSNTFACYYSATIGYVNASSTTALTVYGDINLSNSTDGYGKVLGKQFLTTGLGNSNYGFGVLYNGNKYVMMTLSTKYNTILNYVNPQNKHVLFYSADDYITEWMTQSSSGSSGTQVATLNSSGKFTCSGIDSDASVSITGHLTTTTYIQSGSYVLANSGRVEASTYLKAGTYLTVGTNATIAGTLSIKGLDSGKIFTRTGTTTSIPSDSSSYTTITSSRITLTTPGTYILIGNLEYSSGSAGVRGGRWYNITSGSEAGGKSITRVTTGSTAVSRIPVVACVNISSSTTYALQAVQTSGGALNVVSLSRAVYVGTSTSATTLSS